MTFIIFIPTGLLDSDFGELLSVNVLILEVQANLKFATLTVTQKLDYCEQRIMIL